MSFPISPFLTGAASLSALPPPPASLLKKAEEHPLGVQVQSVKNIFGTKHYSTQLGSTIHTTLSTEPARKLPFPARALVATLKNYPDLRHLDLSHMHALEEGAFLKILKTCPNLEELNLSHCSQISCEVLSQISLSLPNLKKLHLAHTQIDDKTLKQILKHHPLLTQLDLMGCKVSDKTLKSISQYGKRLNSLCLAHVHKITDQGLGQVLESNLVLEKLNLRGCSELTSRSLKKIGLCLPSLKFLDCRDAFASNEKGFFSLRKSTLDRDLAEMLGHLSDLHTLKLSSIPNVSTETGKALLLKASSLKNLSMGSAQSSLDVSSLKRIIEQHPHLHSLELQWKHPAPGVLDATLGTQEALQCLLLKGPTQISREDEKALAQHSSSLTELAIFGEGVTLPVCQNLTQDSSQLTTLRLYDSAAPSFNESFLPSLFPFCEAHPSLTHLTLYTSLMDDACLDLLSQSLPHLFELELTTCQLTEASTQHLREGFPLLTHLALKERGADPRGYTKKLSNYSLSPLLTDSNLKKILSQRSLESLKIQGNLLKDLREIGKQAKGLKTLHIQATHSSLEPEDAYALLEFCSGIEELVLEIGEMSEKIFLNPAPIHWEPIFENSGSLKSLQRLKVGGVTSLTKREGHLAKRLFPCLEEIQLISDGALEILQECSSKKTLSFHSLAHVEPWQVIGPKTQWISQEKRGW